MAVIGFDHVQIAMPKGGEEAARRFYRDLLGLAELEKPVVLAGRGGAWFQGGSAQIHLGVEAEFHPARKAHPALLVDDLPALLAQLKSAGASIKTDIPLPGYHRVSVEDPFGNRIELMERLGSQLACCLAVFAAPLSQAAQGKEDAIASPTKPSESQGDSRAA